jgi:hypothetical protein
MLDNKAKFCSLINLINRKTLHINDRYRLIGFGSSQNKQRSLGIIHIPMRPLPFLQVLTHPLYPWRVVPELRNSHSLIELPYIRVKTLEIRVEDGLVVFYEL